jgi:RHS repeat-associated protein
MRLLVMVGKAGGGRWRSLALLVAFSVGAGVTSLLPASPAEAEATGASYAAAVMASDPYAYWRLGEPDFVPSSAQRLHNEISDVGSMHAPRGYHTPDVALGVPGAFPDDTGSYRQGQYGSSISVSLKWWDLIDLASASISVMFKIEAYPLEHAEAAIFATNDTTTRSQRQRGLGLFLDHDGRLTAYAGPAGAPAALTTESLEAMPLDRWLHVIVSFDQDTGALAMSVSRVPMPTAYGAASPLDWKWAPAAYDDHGTVGFGQQTGGGKPHGLTGWIDEIVFWNRALSSEETEEQFEAGGLPVPEEWPVPAGGWDRSLDELMGERASSWAAGDPVDPVSGNFYDSWVDLPAPGGVFGLDVGRSYNSIEATESVLGRGWRSAFGETAEVDGSGVLRVRLGDGREVAFDPDGLGGWSPSLEYGGRAFTEGDGSFSLELVDGSVMRFGLDGLLEALESWDGQVASIARDGSGRVTSAVSSLGPSLAFSYAPSSGRLVQVSGSDGRVVVYSYDAITGDLVSVTDAAGQTSAFGVDGEGRVSSITDASGVVLVENTYDGWGRVVEQVAPTGTLTFEYLWDRSTKMSLATSSGVETVRYRADALGRVTSVTDPVGKVFTRAYDGASGWPVGLTSRVGAELAAEVDALGRPLTVVAPDGLETTFDYDDRGRPLEVTDPVSGTTSLTYASGPGDANRIPRTITNELGATVTNTVVDGLLVASTDADGISQQFGYDALRRLTSITDGLGRVTSYAYDGAGRLVSTETPEGRVSTITYDDAGKVLETTDAAHAGAAAETTAFTYDPAGRVATVTDPTGAVTRYTYDPDSGLLLTVERPGDAPGTFAAPTVYTYDDLGQVVSVTDPTGVEAGASEGVLGRTESVTDASGAAMSMTYDDDGRVETVTSDASGSIEIDRDPVSDRVESLTDGLGRTTRYDYDDRGLVSEVTEAHGTPAAATTSYGYDVLGRVEQITDPQGRVTERSYTLAGRLASVTDPAGAETTMTYDAAGQMVELADALDHTASFTYWPDGQVHTETTAMGRTTTYTYGPAGRLDTITDPGGTARAHTWSKRGELIAETVSGRGTSEWAFQPDGTMTWAKDPLGNQTSYDFDPAGRLLERTTPFGAETWAYDPATGQVVSHTPVPVSGAPSGTQSWTYDTAGRIATHTDGSGRTRTNTYDPDGQLVEVAHDDGTDSFAHSYSYDDRGRVSEIETPEGPWAYRYDLAGQLTATEAPDGRITRWSYDEAGRRSTITGSDGTGWRYSYDQLSRLTGIAPLSMMADTFTAGDGDAFDPTKWSVTTGASSVSIQGNRLAISTASTSPRVRSRAVSTDGLDAQLTYTFADVTAANRARLDLWSYAASDGSYLRLRVTNDNETATLTRHDGSGTTTLGTFTTPPPEADADRTVRIRHDGDNLKVWLWDPDSGAQPPTPSLETNDATGPASRRLYTESVRVSGANTVTFDDVSHDGATPADPVAAYTYNADAQITGETLPGGTRTWAWNPTTGRLDGYAQDLPNSVRSTSLTYDAAGDIASETTGATTTSYGYDLAGQMTSRGNTTYTYDRGRLAQTKVGNAAPTTFSYDDRSQLTSTTQGANSTTYTFDGAGRRLTEAGPIAAIGYGYDPAGRLTMVDAPTVQERELRPDGLIDKVTFGAGTTSTTHSFDWDAANPVPQVHAFNATSITTTLVRGPTHWAAQRRGTTDTSIGSDIHGSAVVTNAGGGTVAPAASYDPWGVPNLTYTRPTLGYRGELTLGTLVNLRARDHHPTTRQFTTTDPLPDRPGDPTAGNPYHYALNNPINLTDPLGLYPGAERAGLDDGSLLDGLGAGAMDWAKSLGLGFLLDLWGVGKQLTDGCRLQPVGWPPGPDWACIAGNGINMIQDAFGQVRSVIEDAMNAGDGLRSVLTALSLVLPIDMEACEKDGWLYCVGRAAAPVLISALLTGGAALTTKIAQITRNLTSRRSNTTTGNNGSTPRTAPGGGGGQTVRHYTTPEAAEQIAKSGQIRPGLESGKIWVTPDKYADGATAQARLALDKTPGGYFEIPVCRIQCPSAPSTVRPTTKQPGGGIEITTTSPIDTTDLPFIPFRPR